MMIIPLVILLIHNEYNLNWKKPVASENFIYWWDSEINSRKTNLNFQTQGRYCYPRYDISWNWWNRSRSAIGYPRYVNHHDLGRRSRWCFLFWGTWSWDYWIRRNIRIEGNIYIYLSLIIVKLLWFGKICLHLAFKKEWV